MKTAILLTIALAVNACANYQPADRPDVCQVWADLSRECGGEFAPTVDDCHAWMDYFECSKDTRDWLTMEADNARASGWCLTPDHKCTGETCPPDDEWAYIIRINYCSPPNLRERVDQYGVPIER